MTNDGATGTFHKNSSFLTYLEGLPAATLLRLWTDRDATMSVYGLLSSIAQYTIQRLLLVAGASPFEELRSWHPQGFKSIQNPALLQLKHLQILQGRSGEVWLNEEFRTSLLRATTIPNDNKIDPDIISSNVNDEGLASLKNEQERKDIGERVWESILYNLVTGSSNDIVNDAEIDGGNKGHFQQVLTGAGLATTTNNGVNITSRGFQFLLTDRHAQLWTLIIQYFLMIEASGLDVVSCILATARLSLVTPGTDTSTLIPDMAKQFFIDIGLIRRITEEEMDMMMITKMGGGGRDQKKHFDRDSCIATRLVDGLTERGAKPANSGYIIVETNYKVCAYTNSPLQIAILGLFIRLKDRFSNMIQGQLTGTSVQQALSKGITASQLITYLQENIHPIMRKTGQGLSSVIEDQIFLWEKDKNRLRHVDGYLYQEFMNEEAFKKTVDEAKRLDAIQYVNYQKRHLITKEDSHSSLKAFIKSEL